MATGVSGVRYRRKKELSTELTEEQKTIAYKALDGVLERIREGKLSDFRMVIRCLYQNVFIGMSTVIAASDSGSQNPLYIFSKI